MVVLFSSRRKMLGEMVIQAKKLLVVIILVMVVSTAGFLAWHQFHLTDLPKGFASGNGRIQAVEVDISAKIPGRISEILVDEGDFVAAGQVLARMDTQTLEAQKREAEAQLQRAVVGVETAGSVVVQREAERTAAIATIEQRQAEQDGADSKFARSEQLVKGDTISRQVLDDDRARARGARAAVSAAKAQLAASEAAIGAAKSQVIDAKASVDAARSTIQRIQADIDDSALKAPREGRVQYRVAQPGEVLSAGGRVLNLVDVGDVYLNFFLSTNDAGRVAYGGEVRIVLDAAPQYVIPASVSFVADVAQFTPKSVETAVEREKLMFRIKARINPELLQKYIRQVRTGLPGVAYVRLDPQVEWPEKLKQVILP